VYIIATMSFIRKIRKSNGRTYLAEVENHWIDGKCVQKHIRYVGREIDGKTVISSSLSDIEVDEVRVYGPLLVLDYLAKKIGLVELLGDRSKEILSMVYAHCMDYRSINRMKQWFERTDLAMLLPLEGVTEERLLGALDSLETMDARGLQQRIFENTVKAFRIPVSGILYDVTNTYLCGKRCPMGKRGHDKEGVKGRPLVQIGLAVTRENGIPVCHKVMDGNIHDARMFSDFIADLRSFGIRKGIVIYDRGIASAENLKEARRIGWDTLCGLPIRGNLEGMARRVTEDGGMVQISNRIRLRKSIFYAVYKPYAIGAVRGRLAVCFNERQQLDLRESRYDEIEQARQLLADGKCIKTGMAKYFTNTGVIKQAVLAKEGEFDGVTCLFSTARLSKEEMIRFYFDKDLVEKAFHTLKGITRLRPIRHWLYNRVTAHVSVCYLAYLLLSLLQYLLSPLEITAEDALLELDSMYKVNYPQAEPGGFRPAELSLVGGAWLLSAMILNIPPYHFVSGARPGTNHEVATLPQRTTP
jgi:transposase